MTKLRKSLPAVISVAALLVMAAALLADGPPVPRYTVALGCTLNDLFGTAQQAS